MQPGPPRWRRARPVADAPIEALLPRAGDLAKGWLIALVEQAPLETAPAIPTDELVRDGPRVCGAMLRALVSDLDLAWISPGGEGEELVVARAGELAGAVGAEATSWAVDALRGVLWQALRSELGDPPPDLVAELSERLSLVAEVVRGAALRRLRAPADVAAESLRVAAGPLRVADVRKVAPPDAVWMSAVEDEIARAQGSGTVLSLLLVELEEAERIHAVEPLNEASATLGRFAQAVRSVMRREDMLARESDSRAWVLARDTGRAGALALAQRAAQAVRSSPGWRGVPLTVSVGVAVLGEDGHDVTSLMEAAEEGRFAAAASGVTVLEGGSGDE